MPSSLTRVLLVLLLPLLALAACTPKPSPLLRVGSNVWPGYEPLYLARSLGHYDGQPIRLVEMTNASDVMRNLREGNLEAAALTLDEAITVAASGLDLRIVLVFDQSEGADALLGRPGLTDLADIKGRRVGVESGAVGGVMLEAALSRAGLTLADIEKVPLSADQQLPAYHAGRVDAVIAFEPRVGQLREAGAGVLFDSREIPGRILDVLAVRADALPRHEPALRALLAGHFAALRHLRAQPADAQARMTPRLGAQVEQQLAGIGLPDLEGNRRLFRTLQATAQALADHMALEGLLPHLIKIEGLIEPRYILQAPTS